MEIVLSQQVYLVLSVDTSNGVVNLLAVDSVDLFSFFLWFRPIYSNFMGFLVAFGADG